MMSPEERYSRDPVFHNVVDYIAKWVQDYQITPTEAREAAILACVIVESRTIRPWRQGWPESDPEYGGR